MSNVFVIADLHLGHKLVAKLRGFNSVEEHDAELVKRWNSVVTKRDVVYVLGDVFKIDLIPEFKGIKHLALGNHDLRPIIEYAKVFNKISAMFKWDNCILTHIPVHPNQFGRYRLNVHGHLHSNIINDSRYRCVSAEQLNLTPKPLREIVA